MASDDGALEARFANDEDGHGQLVMRLRELSPQLVVMEATGNFQLELSIVLASAKLPMAVVNPRQVRDFAKALESWQKPIRSTLGPSRASGQP